ncbi:hypothetical protein [Methylobacterium aquaticum]|uniref:Uncharacterized protein n=1 Tax=Methylobacterium aquaticum TaxID=270351 RepID=A0A0C6G2M5_9HYPH|nr:hypothetical protein [Methylobacterium aquaticum]BAQ50415.1 hypothetical protein Maq22A_4p60335 [Methylobacterium aquaticum]
MPTIVEALTQAAQDLRDAVAAVLGLRTEFETKFSQNQSTVTTIINNFANRPAVQVIYVDPVNGDETKDGGTLDTARKNLDAVLDGLVLPTEVRLLADVVMQKRVSVDTRLSIIGIQRSSDGYIVVRRKIGFLGIATNSPIPGIGATCAGIFFGTGSVRLEHIDFDLPTVDPGLNYRSHLTSLLELTVAADKLIVTAASGAGALFAAFNSRMTVTTMLQLDAASAGHVFDGVAAGANPNNRYEYTTNVTSA